MDNNFWVNITKPGFFYVVEKWQADESRILYVEKKKALTKWGAQKYSKRCIINHIYSQYIKEKK